MKNQHSHRHVYLLIGSADLRLQAFKQLTQHLHLPNITTLNPNTHPAKTMFAAKVFSWLAFNQLTQTLGSTCDALLFDMEQGVSANSLAIAAGTVQGDGVFAIGIPKLDDWLQQTDDDMARYLPWPLQVEQQVSYFKHYIASQLLNHDQFHTIELDQQTDLSKLKPVTAITKKAFALNHEQNQVLEALLQQVSSYYLIDKTATAWQKAHQASFLTAHRGRGKSSLLGILLAQLLDKGYRAAVTAPRKKALQTLEYHFHKTQSEHTNKTTALPFHAPDELIKKSEELAPAVNVLIIDEAAAIPLALLENLAKTYAFVIFSSTDHGYESGGKGFGLRLAQHLEKQEIILTHQTLTTPVRWQEGDYLEKWLDSLLFLYADLSPTQKSSTKKQLTTNSHNKINKHNAEEHRLVQFNGKDWLNNFDALPSLFQLLINAHYQTSPNDIRWILDDPSTTTFSYYRPISNAQKNERKQSVQPTCVAIVTEEGPIEEKLAQAILEGKRRPRGHLLPQSLLAHEGHQNAALFTYWRISRIATQIDQRRNNHASALLEKIEYEAKGDSIDFLCASFAATKETLLFWQKNGFICVRLGTSKDQASACYSVMMVKPLNGNAARSSQQWQQDYLANLTINLPRDYIELEQGLISLLIKNNGINKKQQTEKDLADLLLFVHHKRPYLTVRAQLTRFVQNAITHHHLKNSHPQYDFLQTLIQEPANEINFQQFGLYSKKEVEVYIKKTILELIKSSNLKKLV